MSLMCAVCYIRVMMGGLSYMYMYKGNICTSFSISPLFLFSQNANLLALLGDCNYYLEDVAKAKDCYEKVVEYVTPPVNIIAVLLRLADLYIQCYEVQHAIMYMYISTPGSEIHVHVTVLHELHYFTS